MSGLPLYWQAIRAKRLKPYSTRINGLPMPEARQLAVGFKLKQWLKYASN
ncbi:hypothetical protein [Methylosoma difficile]